ncbi:Receptor-type tyrosine-protein phosphatase T [Halotydeus destructor]|nr:Receptor-type tyrosine-protein phosphatase T [Halotydeus destructor]
MDQTKLLTDHPITLQSRPVHVSELSAHIRSMSEDDGFNLEYSSVPAGQTAPWESAVTPANKGKNYCPGYPYDHSRVKLNVEARDLDGITDENSLPTDYINASLIDGYKQDGRYIATQGPKSNTLADFWRMVWQNDARIVIMLANLVEEGKVSIFSVKYSKTRLIDQGH